MDRAISLPSRPIRGTVGDDRTHIHDVNDDTEHIAPRPYLGGRISVSAAIAGYDYGGRCGRIIGADLTAAWT